MALALCALTLLAVASGCGGGATAVATPIPMVRPSSTPAPGSTPAVGTTTASGATPTVGSTPAAGTTPAAGSNAVVARATPDAGRAMAHLRMLAEDIGSRPSTTEAERKAAEYIRAQLEAAGYRASIERFDVQVTMGGVASVSGPTGRDLEAVPMAGAPDGNGVGPLVEAKLGRAADYAGVTARDAVVLVTRGESSFSEKARIAQANGAVALVVLNTDSDAFRGDLGNAAVSIPVVGLAGSDGAAVRALLGQRVTVTSQVRVVSGPSQNVVGQPSAAPCTAYLGAHYDSVPEGPGANDNASGTALMLELARVRKIDGLCVIAFGSEEIGLFGSKAFIRAHKVQGARFMLNFDMVAKATGPTLIGDADLAKRVLALPAANGMSLRHIASFGAGSSSDHASFLDAGVPALMFYSGNDQFIHTRQDDIRNVTQGDLAKLLDLAVATIDDLYRQ